MRARAIVVADVRGLGARLWRGMRSSPAMFFTARGLPQDEPVDPAARQTS
jgi:hypothetical protein